MYACIQTSDLDLDLEHCNLSFVPTLLPPTKLNLYLGELALIGLQFVTERSSICFTGSTVAPPDFRLRIRTTANLFTYDVRTPLRRPVTSDQ